MIVDPLRDVNLTNDEFIMIARIGQCWSLAEFSLGHAVARSYGVAGGAAKDLVFGRDFGSLVGLVKKRQKDGATNASQDNLIKELSHCADAYRSTRNVYAHGLVLTGEDGSRRLTTLKGAEADPDSLPSHFERAKYTAHVALRLLSDFNGQPVTLPLPARPE